MIATRQAERIAKQVFRFCVVDGMLDENRVRLVTNSILSHRRRGYLRILSGFKRLLKAELARHKASVESTIPLTDDLRTRLESGITRLYGTGLTWSFTQNAALIGGMRIRVGSDVYDGSVRFALDKLARSRGIVNGSKARA